VTVQYASLTVNLDKRDKTGKPALIKYPTDGIDFLIDSELVNLTLSVIENGSETELLTAPVYVEYGKPKQYVMLHKVKQNG